MGIIKLENVSKYYYSKGVIASGFTKINLEFNNCEFVAITGESGSGKSTLLNVISGLDSYEEGEMYINGQETSHYSEKDFENYRRKYISNIFQNFNLVNSYTVYQNIELVLLLNGAKKRESRARVIELIKKVNLYKFRNTKVSKLSGGQKQRVAIARALAKDTPIIIADEPTGSLDSRSAKAIIKLLSEIAKDKLVIIVTHNYEQVAEYVTRNIKMHDGKILEDRIIRNDVRKLDSAPVDYRDLTFFNKIGLGIRNTFNILPKFFLLLAVYLFIVVALMAEYSSFKQARYLSSRSGYNSYFVDTSDKRIIIKKNDNSTISDLEYEKIEKMPDVSRVVKNDLLIDKTVSLNNDNFYLYGSVDSLDNLGKKLSVGRMPTEDNEVVVVGSPDDYYLKNSSELFKQDLYVVDDTTGDTDKSTNLKVVGIVYDKNKSYSSDSKIYFSDKMLEKFRLSINLEYSKVKVLFLDKYHDVDNTTKDFKVVFNDDVKDGEVYIPSNLNQECKNENCVGNTISIFVDNIYFNDSINVNVSKTYSKENMKSILNIDNYEDNLGTIYISVNDYNRLFNKGNYQSSVYVKNVDDIDSIASILKKDGFTTLKIKDTMISDSSSEVTKIISVIVTIALIITLFFISYFVIKIILKSRQVYYSTIRMLGASVGVSMSLVIIELLNVAYIAYLTFLYIIYLNSQKVIKVGFINTILKYLTFSDYAILFVIVSFISILISLKYSQKLFKSSAIKTLKEGV